MYSNCLQIIHYNVTIILLTRCFTWLRSQLMSKKFLYIDNFWYVFSNCSFKKFQGKYNRTDFLWPFTWILEEVRSDAAWSKLTSVKIISVHLFLVQLFKLLFYKFEVKCNEIEFFMIFYLILCKNLMLKV